MVKNNNSSQLEDTEERFRRLQARLPEVFRQASVDRCLEHTVVVVPSMSIEARELSEVKGSVHYEERLLSFLTLLGNPKTHIVFVSSLRIPDEIISYYLQLLPGVPFSHARQRLHLISLMDNSDRPLTQKILERPTVLERIRRSIVQPKASYLEIYRASALERELALALELPMLGPSLESLFWGTKSGGRSLFAQLGIPHAQGFENIYSLEQLAESIMKLALQCPDLNKVVVKLNDGFSGVGNALYDLAELRQRLADPGQTPAALEAYLLETLPKDIFVDRTTWAKYSQILFDQGGVVEGYIEGQDKSSPTVQLGIVPGGEVRLLSTHEQIMGGEENIHCVGCRLPAQAKYSQLLHEYGLSIGQRLAELGVLGPVSIDFVAVPKAQGEVPGTMSYPADSLIAQDCEYNLYAMELNIRHGGTTNPLHTMHFLTGGHYDAACGEYLLPSGRPVYYVSSSSIASPESKGLSSLDLMDIITDSGLHYDSSTYTGVLFYMIGALSQFGILGATCIARTPQEAWELHLKAKESLRQAALSLSFIPDKFTHGQVGGYGDSISRNLW